MKLLPKKSKRSLGSVYRHLFEQGLFGDEPAGDKKGDDEGEDAPTGDEEEDKGDDKGEGEKEGDTGGEEDKDKEEGGGKDEKKEKAPPITAEDEARLSDAVDEELESLLVDFETDARKAAAIDSRRFKTESRSHALKRVLFETSAQDIDLNKFASDVARLVKNYDTLMDMKSIILNKACSYIKFRYGDETEKALKDVLEQDYRLVSNAPKSEKREEPEIPIAVGARTPSA